MDAHTQLEDPTAGGGAAAADLRHSVTEATERIQLIIDSAERVAAEIIAEAHVEANRQMKHARQDADRVASEQVRVLSEVTRALMEQAAQMRHQSEEFLRALEAAMRRISGAGVEAPAAAVQRLRDPQAAGPNGTPATPEAVLRATQMAASGRNRAQISRALLEEFGIDPAPILNEVLGA